MNPHPILSYAAKFAARCFVPPKTEKNIFVIFMRAMLIPLIKVSSITPSAYLLVKLPVVVNHKCLLCGNAYGSGNLLETHEHNYHCAEVRIGKHSVARGNDNLLRCITPGCDFSSDRANVYADHVESSEQ
jgi:hypothetical protein